MRKTIFTLAILFWHINNYAQRVHSSDFDYYDEPSNFGLIDGVMTIVGIVLILVAYSYWETKNTLSWILGIIALVMLGSAISAILNLVALALEAVLTYGIIIAGVVAIIWVIGKIFSK